MAGSLVDSIACAWPLAGRRLLPLEAAVALKPWFDRSTLQKGFSLLMQGTVGRFVLYRSGAGAVFNDSVAAFLLMPPSDALPQGYVCRDGSCTLCRGNRPSGRRCRHQAAVALLNLRTTGDFAGFVPVWRLLKSNPWGAIARYLQQEAEVGSISFQARKAGAAWRLEGCKENGFSLAVSLSRHLAQQLHCFHGSAIRWHDSMPEQDEFGPPARAILDKIALLTATDTEKRLNKAGSRSIGQQREDSIQTALVRLLALSLPVSSLRIQRGRDGSFRLTAARQTLKNLIKPFILRRTRSQVLTELPEVIEDIRGCRLSDDQVGLYRQVVDSATPLVDDLLDGLNGGQHYIGILAVITRLKQICDHPCLLEGSRDWGMYESGKWDLLLELLEECLAGDKKVVVFSQFTRMLDILESYLDAQGVEYAALRGHLSPGARQQAIKRFNTEKSCMVCCASLLAGGVGIDLTAAQVVVHYDRWWNPAREEQATARVHRMGQKHVVQVIKLVTLGTLEEKIHALIEKKRTLARDILSQDDASALKRLSREDLAGLLRWQEG